MASIIYYFTGTGNSLKVARDIAKGLGSTTIESMGKPVKLNDTYENIGKNIKCFANYLCLYPMAKNVNEKAQAQAKATKVTIDELKTHTVTLIPKNGLISLIHGGFIKSLKGKDWWFNVSSACNG